MIIPDHGVDVSGTDSFDANFAGALEGSRVERRWIVPLLSYRAPAEAGKVGRLATDGE
jgi:hypothetical protein